MHANVRKGVQVQTTMHVLHLPSPHMVCIAEHWARRGMQMSQLAQAWPSRHVVTKMCGRCVRWGAWRECPHWRLLGWKPWAWKSPDVRR